MKKPIPALLLSASLAVLSLGCGSNNGTVEPVAGTAEIQVAHLSPDAGPVDIWLDGAVVLPSVPFEAISGYLPIDAGDHRVQVTPAGQTSPIVIDAVLGFTEGTATTVAATGLLGAMDVQAIVLADDRNAGSQVQVRFVHASPDAPPVDVALTGGPVLIPDTAFREASGYTTVAGGTYDLEVRVAGTQDVALSLPGTVLTNGTNITVFAIGELRDSSLGALVTVDAP